MKSRIVLFLLAWMAVLPAGAQQMQTTFEMRYFTKDPKADGSTDFHGETEWLDTDQRVDLLNKYAAYASRFWGDPGLDTPLFPESAVQERLARVKPQPLTSVRRTLPLKAWRAYGYKKGKEAEKELEGRNGPGTGPGSRTGASSSTGSWLLREWTPPTGVSGSRRSSATSLPDWWSVFPRPRGCLSRSPSEP